jgi:putative redox protein
VLHADRATEHPKVFTHITLEYVFTGKGISKEAVERAIDLSENKYCSGLAMLRQAVNIQTKYRVVDE